MTTSTRDQFIRTAQKLFAEKGFYGVSIAAIAQQMGLTKQALLHHFGSKEKLYGEVLQRISNELMAESSTPSNSELDPIADLTERVLSQYRMQMGDQDAARLIMRELLDNEQRASSAANWYLQPWLDSLVECVLAIKSQADISRGQALALVYQFLGAAHYFAVSQPTLSRMFDQAVYDEACQHYEAELRALIIARLGD